MALYLLFSPLLLPASLALGGNADNWRATGLEMLKGMVSYLLLLPVFVLLLSIAPTNYDIISFFTRHLLTLSLLPPVAALALFLVSARLFRTDTDQSIRLYAFLGGFFFVAALTEFIRGDGYFEPLQLFLLPSYRLLFILIAPGIIAPMRADTSIPPQLLWPLVLLCLLLPAITARLYERGYTLLAILLCAILFLWITITWIIGVRR